MNRLLSAFAIVMLLIGPWGAAPALGHVRLMRLPPV